MLVGWLVRVRVCGFCTLFGKCGSDSGGDGGNIDYFGFNVGNNDGVCVPIQSVRTVQIILFYRSSLICKAFKIAKSSLIWH